MQLVAKNILKFCLHGMLKDRQRLTLFQFLDALRKIPSEKIKEEDMQHLEMEVNEALALMERDFPVDIQVCQILFHLIIISHCMQTLFYSGNNNTLNSPQCEWHETVWPCLCDLDVWI